VHRGPDSKDNEGTNRTGRNRRFPQWKAILLGGFLCASIPGALPAQMTMGPYFTAINDPLRKHSVMLMALSDLQAARFGRDFSTAMVGVVFGRT
jgi:hypothetical protein